MLTMKANAYWQMKLSKMEKQILLADLTVLRRVNLSKKEEANKFGVMAQPMRVGGKTIKLMVKEG